MLPWIIVSLAGGFLAVLLYRWWFEEILGTCLRLTEEMCLEHSSYHMGLRIDQIAERIGKPYGGWVKQAHLRMMIRDLVDRGDLLEIAAYTGDPKDCEYCYPRYKRTRQGNERLSQYYNQPIRIATSMQLAPAAPTS